MEFKFTEEEIRDAVRAARFYCRSFTEQQFEGLMELRGRFAESGYLEAVHGIARLEGEKGISCAQALDATEKLITEKANLEKLNSNLQERTDALSGQIKQAVAEHEQLKKSIAEARKELTAANKQLSQTRNEQSAAEKKLEKVKQQVDREIEEYRQNAGVTKEETAAAAQLKAEVEKHGFSLEVMLGLSEEFASYENAREELAEALKQRGSLKEDIAHLVEQGKSEKAKLRSDIARMESEMKDLDHERIVLNNTVSQLRSDLVYEETVRQFHRRYSGVSVLLEHLATWDRVFFMRCVNPFFAMTGGVDAHSGNAHFWTDKQPAMCPQCGHNGLAFDERIYQSLDQPIGIPGKVVLGE
jgi:hypothetical protein